jgi:hypothetical protein
MKLNGKHEFFAIKDIELDVNNPRIKRFVEMYGPKPTPEQIHLALGAGIDDPEGQAGPTFSKLKQSILTNGGVIQPVLVNRLPTGQLICIEGNTRVCLYQSFIDDKVKGNWETIPAIVYDNLDEEDIDAIRLQAHLVGPRQWDPYSKAKYLTYLRNKAHLPFNQLVDYCGGSKKAVQELIDAYSDMEKYYRPLLESDSDFDPRRFSGFVELQKENVKQAIVQSGHTLQDFAKWIHGRKIEALAQVRWLPRIFKNKKATEIFLKSGAQAAMQVLDRPDLGKILEEASLSQLARAFTYAVSTIGFTEAQELKTNPTSDTAEYLREAKEAIEKLMLHVDGNE